MTDIEESTKNRPLSPHLQIYRPTISMIMSVVHRLTGLALYAGVSFLFFWFMSILLGQNIYLIFRDIMQSFIVQIIFFFFTWAFFHHMFGGIRHFIWDINPSLLTKPKVNAASYILLGSSFIGTIILDKLI